jgi:hypothetical protein
VTALFYPIPLAPEVYFKADLGWNIYANTDYIDVFTYDATASTYGGPFWAIGAGYEFAYGIFAELSYNFYYSEVVIRSYNNENFNTGYSTLSLSVGYRFNLPS